MDDIILLTADSVRFDFMEDMSHLSALDTYHGIAVGHYTRPSLASLHSSSLMASVQSKPVSPTLAEILSDAGYSCIGLAPTAQCDPAFGFDRGFDRYDNYMEGSGNPIQNRRSWLREFLGKFDLVRTVYRHLFPMEAFLDSLPSDDTVIDRAVNLFNNASPPRFLWVHLMESHRPYGTGDNAVPKAIDRKAELAGGDSLLGKRRVSETERDIIISKYRDALQRTDSRASRLLDEVEGDPTFVFTSDHGDEFGEDGYYYHQGYRRRVPDTILSVPVVFEGLDRPIDRLSLLDIAPTLLSLTGISIPESWEGLDLLETSRQEFLSIAPWHDKATIAWQDSYRKLVAKDATVSIQTGDVETKVTRAAVDEEITQHLQELGYMDAG